MLDVHLGRPLVRGGLTVFPIWNGAAVATPQYDVVDRRVTVVENASASVATLEVVNVGPRAALMLEGELLVGGLQDRMVAASTMIAPRTRRDLPVRCVERGRWSGATTQHAVAGRHAPLALRAAGDQEGTWAAVTAIERREGGGRTHALGDATANLERRAERLVGELRPLPFTSGLLVGVGGRPTHLEVFDSPATLAAMWSQLIRAAAVAAADARPVATPGAQARAFVEEVRRMPLPRDGAAREQRGGLTLTSLGWRGRVVHAVAA